ncbi:hypothetical protein [Kribbella sindirgiensis]|uniref:Uncharacterized protein n=1 Tax=Kribbella sindirgiensis TaxID=1124744 RepID=A0A4R0I054_9ACTN|nr:hypothetical protein [Kribbella sindirgiensis]TCC19930.1 hypothetical protein E0H50_37505 [Kribbella sindirgiensis]
MAITFTKKQVERMVETLDQDHEDMTEAAKAALDTALEIVMERAKFTVVGQLYHPTGHLSPNEARSNQVALGWYATEKQATDAALQLVYSTATHETFKSWTLPIFNGTPAAYYITRKKAREAAEIALKGGKNAELERRIQWFRDNPGQEPPNWGPIWKTKED